MEMQNMSTPTAYQEQATTTNASASASANANTEQSPPVKRRPGRPKGSTKKNLTGEPVTPKIKRPVGRPRKDGFPAGSVAPSRPRPLKQARHSFAGTSSIGYPQQHHLGGYIPVIDPHLQSSDDWATLSRTSPNAFLSVLLSALAAPNPISTAGPSVEDAFKSHLGSLQPNTAHQPIPALYAILKTFWLPSSPAYFSLTASASTARTPSEHRFLYWDPQPLVFNGIACPACSAPLINKGRISSGPIKIYDIEKPFFIIGCEYACVSPSCQRTFASTDSSIFRSLPGKLQDEFPARLLCGDVDAGSGSGVWNWGAMGVSWSLWNMVRGCLRLGMGREAILRLVEAVQRGVPEDEEEEQGEGGDNMKIDGEGGGGGGDPSGSGGVQGSGGVGGSGSASGEGGGTTMPLGSAQDQTSTLPPNFLDAYNDAWRANSGASASTSANTAVSGPTPATANITNTAATTNQPANANASASSTPSLSSLTPSTPTVPPPTTIPPTSTISISTSSPSMQNTTSSPSTNTTIQQNKPSIPPTVGVYDYAKTFPAYPYPAYAFFPPASTSASSGGNGSTGGSGGLKRGYPFTGTDEAVSGSSSGGGGAKSTLPAPPPATSSGTHPQPPALAQPVQPSSPATTTPAQPSPAPGSTTTKRAPRHCVKCGSQECKGKGGRSFCTNGCQDCGRLECRGRNSRRPDKRCAEGWGGSG